MVEFLGGDDSVKYKNGDKVSARVNDPDGNEHKVWFIYVNGLWELY